MTDVGQVFPKNNLHHNGEYYDQLHQMPQKGQPVSVNTHILCQKPKEYYFQILEVTSPDREKHAG